MARWTAPHPPPEERSGCRSAAPEPSRDGEELVLEGEATTGDAEPGNLVHRSFVGTVDGEQVFEQDCLGDGVLTPAGISWGMSTSVTSGPASAGSN